MAPPPQHENHMHGRGVNLVIIYLTLNSIAALLVVSRLFSRAHYQRKLFLSDFTIVASCLFSIAMTVANCIAVEYGYGKHFKTLTPYDMHKNLQAFWVSQIVYKFTINLTKTSICLLYLQIFPGRTFRRCAYATITYVLLYAFASIVATIFQCTPIPRAWDRKGVPGQCINLTAFWYSNAVANIMGDMVTLFLPMIPTWRLEIPRRQKVGLMGVFALGGFVCVTSILRMTQLKAGSKATDTSYGTLDSTIWTGIEANTAIICACMPMLKAPLTVLCARLLPSTNRSSAGRRASVSTPLSTLSNTAIEGPESINRRRQLMLSPKKNDKRNYGRLSEEEGEKGGAMGDSIEGRKSGSSRFEKEDRIDLAKGDVELGYVDKSMNVEAGKECDGRPF